MPRTWTKLPSFAPNPSLSPEVNSSEYRESQKIKDNIRSAMRESEDRKTGRGDLLPADIRRDVDLLRSRRSQRKRRQFHRPQLVRRIGLCLVGRYLSVRRVYRDPRRAGAGIPLEQVVFEPNTARIRVTTHLAPCCQPVSAKGGGLGRDSLRFGRGRWK